MNKAAIEYADLTKCGSPGGKAVLLALARHVNYREEGSLLPCWPSQSRIAEKTELSIRHVRRILAELCKKGIIIREGRKYFLPVENRTSCPISEAENDVPKRTPCPVKEDIMSGEEDTMSGPSEVKKKYKKNITTSPPKIEPPKKAYAYEGDVIRLLEKDLDRYRKKHSGLSDLELQAALDQVDFGFRAGSSDDWFWRLERNLNIAAEQIIKTRKSSAPTMSAQYIRDRDEVMAKVWGNA